MDVTEKIRPMNTFIATIDPSLAPKLRADLELQGFEFSAPPYTIFSAQKKGVSLALYTSGKITVQGKGKDEFITSYLEPEILQNFSYSYPEIGMDMTSRIGIDEAGKGDFFGPLCIGGVQANEDTIRRLLKIGVKDSKQMTDKSSLEMARRIKDTVPHSTIRISPRKYNELYASFKNLNLLLAWGHATAIAELVQKTECRNVLIDQFSSQPLVERALKQKNISVALTQRPRAEEDPVVAAASILARASFLEGLNLLSEQIGVVLPKGAGAKILIVGRGLARQKGPDILNDVAKLHFKTTKEILSSL